LDHLRAHFPDLLHSPFHRTTHPTRDRLRKAAPFSEIDSSKKPGRLRYRWGRYST
jgi:hypothetical protein